MKCLFALMLIISSFTLSACTTGEVLSGAAGAGAGYVIGREDADD